MDEIDSVKNALNQLKEERIQNEQRHLKVLEEKRKKFNDELLKLEEKQKEQEKRHLEIMDEINERRKLMIKKYEEIAKKLN